MYINAYLNNIYGYKNETISNSNLRPNIRNKSNFQPRDFNSYAPKDTFIKNTNNKNHLSFRSKPWNLNPYLESYKSGERGIEYFNKLKLGNYLDIDGDTHNIENRKIREKNLAFLDIINDEYDKKVFVDHYKNLTDFPDLKKVSQNIKNAFINAYTKSETDLKYNNFEYHEEYEVLSAGYDGVSSVAKNKSLPGSDLDKAFVILKGCNPNSSNVDEKDKKIVENFKKALWENTDQRILSYNHDEVSFPQVYTLNQVKKLLTDMEKKNEFIPKYELKIKKPRTFFERLLGLYRFVPEEKYKHLQNDYSEDYVSANKYFIDLCKFYPKSNNWDLNVNTPSRENIYMFGYTLEAMSKGEVFKKNTEIDNCLKNSPVADLINVSQIKALKNKPDGTKGKYSARAKLEKEFNNWDLNNQFNFIKTMIKSSCSDDTGLFPDYFKSSESNRFAKLKDVIGV